MIANESIYQMSRRAVLDSFHLALVTNALTRTNGNVSQAAKHLGIQRQSLQKLIVKHRVARANFVKVTK